MATPYVTEVTRAWDGDEEEWMVEASIPGARSQSIAFRAQDAAEALVESRRRIARHLDVSLDDIEAQWREDVSHTDSRAFRADS